MSPPAFQSRFGFAGLLLLVGLLLWTFATWPLSLVFSKAIPNTHLRSGTQVVQPIAVGDHLQLLYHFWLGLDAFTGHSPLFHNVYEFNLGDDSARMQPDLYYVPFSLLYMAVAPWAGHAAGWNAAGLASVLLGVLGLGLFARRFTSSPATALLAALLVSCLPYRWITLFSGSPTGFAMAFPPLLAYGLDRAIRDRSPLGGCVAGLALFFSFTTDLHVFYFSVLATPFFALLSLWMSVPSLRQWPGEIRGVILPLIPFALLAVAAAGMGAWASHHLAGSAMASGRTLAEMASYSPRAIGLVSTANAGMTNHAYFGIPLFALLATGLGCWSLPLFRRDSYGPSMGNRWAVVALVAAVAIVLLLALGIHGPFEGIPIRIIRKVIPKYSMIRQPAKIYGLLPVLLAPLLVFLLDGISRFGRRRPVRWAAVSFAALLSVWALLQSLGQTVPGFCRLPGANPAYEAVARDEVANAGRPPHALALPLWPGESHWTSLCEYAVMYSRVRLVNGYAPAVPAGYFADVFKKYESLNQGFATDDQLDRLLELGVRHVLLHANAFPEKVSPFPPAATLRALVGHPRLALIGDDGQTFAFRILPKHPVEHAPHVNWTDTLHAAALQWSWNPTLVIANGQTSRLFLRAPVAPAPNLRYLLRLASGSAQPLLIPPGSDGISSLTHPIAGLPDWLQAELPNPTGALASAISGPVSLEYAILAAGELPAPGPDGVIRVPPALLFHTGHSSPGQSAVSFDPETVAAGQVLYGPNLPVPPGVYDITLSYTATGPAGIFRLLTLPGKQPIAGALLDPGTETLVFPAVSLGDDPIRFEFHYSAQSPVVLRDIQLAPATLQLQPAATAR
jgi:hypothetical protein